MKSRVGCPYFKRRGGFNRVRATYRTKYAYSVASAVSQNGKYPVSCKQGAFLLCKNARANKRFHRYSGKVRSGPLSLVSGTQVKQWLAHRLPGLLHHSTLVSATQVEQWLAQIRADDCPRSDEAKVFSRMRKYLRQTNGFSDKGTKFAGTTPPK